MSSRTVTEVEAPSIPTDLDSPRAKLVYLYLRVTQGATPRELCDALDVKGLTLYPTLETLARRGLVERDGQEFYCT